MKKNPKHKRQEEKINERKKEKNVGWDGLKFLGLPGETWATKKSGEWERGLGVLQLVSHSRWGEAETERGGQSPISA